MSAPLALVQARDRIEGSFSMSHPGARVSCGSGDHYVREHIQHRPTPIARFVCMLVSQRDGRRFDIVAYCPRCAYGLNGSDVIARLPIRYPRLDSMLRPVQTS